VDAFRDATILSGDESPLRSAAARTGRVVVCCTARLASAEMTRAVSRSLNSSTVRSTPLRRVAVPLPRGLACRPGKVGGGHGEHATSNRRLQAGVRVRRGKIAAAVLIRTPIALFNPEVVGTFWPRLVAAVATTMVGLRAIEIGDAMRFEERPRRNSNRLTSDRKPGPIPRRTRPDRPAERRSSQAAAGDGPASLSMLPSAVEIGSARRRRMANDRVGAGEGIDGLNAPVPSPGRQRRCPADVLPPASLAHKTPHTYTDCCRVGLWAIPTRGVGCCRWKIGDRPD